MDRLTNFLYPTYGSVDGGATVITSSPLLKMKFANLITQPNEKGTVETSGLVGRMDGFSYTPDFDSGVFMGNGKNPKLFPQTINVSCTFYVLHTHKLGWRKSNGDEKFQSKAGFPHDMNPGAKKFVGTSRTEAGKRAAAGEVSFPTGGMTVDPVEAVPVDASGVGADSESERAATRAGLPGYAFVE